MVIFRRSVQGLDLALQNFTTVSVAPFAHLPLVLPWDALYRWQTRRSLSCEARLEASPRSLGSYLSCHCGLVRALRVPTSCIPISLIAPTDMPVHTRTSCCPKTWTSTPRFCRHTLITLENSSRGHCLGSERPFLFSRTCRPSPP